MNHAHVKELNDQFIGGVEAGDASAVAAVYASDGKLLAPNAEAMEGDAIERFWEGAIKGGLGSLTLDTASIVSDGDVVVEVGLFTLLTAASGGDVIDTGNYVVVHARQPDGDWRYAVDMFCSNRPAA